MTRSMIGVRFAAVLMSLSLLTLSMNPARADPADAFFASSTVQEIRITFTGADWYSTLYDAHANDPDDPYFQARFECLGTVLDTVGVRFKGNASFDYPTVKKSFKIDFDEYDEDNPDLRFLDFARGFVPAMRAVHVRMYVNDEYWGLYLAVEQVDKTFLKERFGNGEDGNLFKAATDDASGPQGDFGSDLTWLGSDPQPYHDFYQLKTNEEEDDYSQLLEFIDVLNNTPPADFPENLEPILDVFGALRCLALNSLFVNLDSYIVPAHNYYLYDRDDTGRMTHLHWDVNEGFGRFLMGVPPGQNPLHLDPFWLPEFLPGVPDTERPLLSRLWEVPGYADYYARFLSLALQSGFDTQALHARVDELADLIRSDVHADPHKMYTNEQFEENLTSDIYGAGPDGLIYGLVSFVTERASYLSGVLPGIDPVPELVVNEFMADNDSGLQDETGATEDWLELYNQGGGDVSLNGLHLTDDLTDPLKWALPDTVLAAGGFLVVFCDNDEEDGPLHANFKLDADGEVLALVGSPAMGAPVIDSHVFWAQLPDVSEGRMPDGADSWTTFDEPTPGASNGSVQAVFLAQFQAEPSAGSVSIRWLLSLAGGEAEFRLQARQDDQQWEVPYRAEGELEFVATDNSASLLPGGEVIYTLYYREAGGAWLQLATKSLTVPPVSILPRLLPAYPNPFNPRTTLTFDLPAAGATRLEIYDTRGRRVAVLVDGMLPAGHHEVEWTAVSDKGRDLPSGVYLVHLNLEGRIDTGRLSLVR